MTRSRPGITKSRRRFSDPTSQQARERRKGKRQPLRFEPLARGGETKRKELESKRVELEEKRKFLLARTHGELEVTLDQEKMRPGEPEVTKELLSVPLFQLAMTKDEKTLPICLEAKTLAEQSRCLDFETKRKEKDNQRKEKQKKRKYQMKMTK